MPVKLEDFLARVYDRTQRTIPQTQHRSVLRWKLVQEDAKYLYPYRWCTSSDADDFVSGKHLTWGSAPHDYWGMAYPTYIACGAGTSAAGGSALGDEIARFPVSLVRDFGWGTAIGTAAGGTAVVRFSGEAKRDAAVGTWNEVGLFYGNAVTHMLSTCDVEGSWVSDNILSVTTTTVRDGSGALRSQGSNLVSFANLGGLTPPSDTFYESDKLQLWYYINDISYLDSSGNLTVRIGSSSDSHDTDYYEFTKPCSGLSSGWNWLSWVISDYTSKSGSPDINNIVTFRLTTPKLTEAAVEGLDRVRLFQHSGTLWGYQALGTALEKQWGETRWLYWDAIFD